MVRMRRRNEHSRSEEIQRDIDRIRAELDHTADTLQERFTPGQLVDELWGRVRRTGGRAGAADVFRDHPVPFALMGLGLGWLAIEQRSSGRVRSESASGGEGDDSGPSLTARAREAGEQTRKKAGQQTERVQHAFNRMLDENPVALGTFGFAIGLASGISAPSTETEDRLRGRTSDRVERKTQHRGETAAEGAASVAEEASSATEEELERQRHASGESPTDDRHPKPGAGGFGQSSESRGTEPGPHHVEPSHRAENPTTGAEHPEKKERT